MFKPEGHPLSLLYFILSDTLRSKRDMYSKGHIPLFAMRKLNKLLKYFNMLYIHVFYLNFQTTYEWGIIPIL
jgi:hypothetical protein